MLCLDHPINWLSIDFNNIWESLVMKEVLDLKLLRVLGYKRAEKIILS